MEEAGVGHSAPPGSPGIEGYVKAFTIDEQAALTSVHGTPFQQAAQVAMIRRINDGDFFSIPDRYGRFHSNLTNLKKTLRPFLRYRDSELVNLDIANSQPMVFCLLLVNLLSNNGKLNNLIDYEFSESSNPYAIDIDEVFLLSLSSSSSLSSTFSFSLFIKKTKKQERGEGEGEGEGERREGEALPILRRFNVENSNKLNYYNMLCESDFSYDKPETYRTYKNYKTTKKRRRKREKHLLYYDGLVLR